MTVNILGTIYEIVTRKYHEDGYFEAERICGYCDELMKRIVIGQISTFPNWENEEQERCNVMGKQTLRHEIVHAFLTESGLSSSSGQYENGWAKNEEMVDWMALQGPKIYNAWLEVGAL